MASDEDRYLRLWFESVDTDNSGAITEDELKRALDAERLRFPSSVIAQMIKMYDRDQSGNMDFTEFVRLHKFLNWVQDAFRRNIRNRESIPFNDMYTAIRDAGYSLDKPSFEAVCESFDRDGSKKFELNHYVSICIFLESAKNLFEEFAHGEEHVTLDFRQFVYCCKHYFGHLSESYDSYDRCCKLSRV